MGGMRWTSEQFDEYRDRLRVMIPLSTVANTALNCPADPGPESKLQAKCEAWCKVQGFPFLSFHKSKKVKDILPAGWPDMLIVLKNRVIFIELKSKEGRLSPEQKATRIAFLSLGHTVHECRSYRKFLEVVK